jgi:hypothetical protein
MNDLIDAVLARSTGKEALGSLSGKLMVLCR